MKSGLSTLGWAAVALVGLLIAIGLLAFYIYQVPRLISSGTQNQIFYLLLIPWALASAAFLFGAMKSYAHYTYKKMGNVLELGGPVVLFCLVLLGGFKLVPAAADTFDLTVRAHSADDSVPVINFGKVTLDLGSDRRTEPFGQSGEANFKGIPSKFVDATIKVLPEVEGYVAKWKTARLDGRVLELELDKASVPKILLKGTVYPPPGKQEKIKIMIEGQNGEAEADEYGRFEIPVEGKDGDRVRLKAFSGAKMVFDDFRTLPGPATLPLKPD